MLKVASTSQDSSWIFNEAKKSALKLEGASIFSQFHIAAMAGVYTHILDITNVLVTL
jgi:hypothetical protein